MGVIVCACVSVDGGGGRLCACVAGGSGSVEWNRSSSERFLIRSTGDKFLNIRLDLHAYISCLFNIPLNFPHDNSFILKKEKIIRSGVTGNVRFFFREATN